MRKIIITLGILLVLFIIVIGLAVLNLNFFITKNKGYFLSQIEESIGRKISVGEINAGFREGIGIRLKDFSIADDKSFSDSEFIRALDIQINVEFLPLLSKKINITKLILNKPVINIIENKNGKYNFASFGAEDKSENSGDAKSKNKAQKLPIFASSIIIKEGQINYVDEKNETEFQIQKINLGIKDLDFDKEVPVNLEAAILASEPNVKIKGNFGPVTPDFDLSSLPAKGSVEIVDLNINTLKKFLPIIKERLPKGLDISGPIQAKFKFSGRTDSLTFSEIDLRASVFGASVPNLELAGNLGPVGENAENFSLDTEFKLLNANLGKLRKFSLIKDSIPNSLSTQGTLDISGKISGTPEDLKFNSVKMDATRSRLAVIGKFLKPKDIPFVITAGGRISEEVIELKNSEIKLNSLNLRTEGQINRGTTNLINLSISSNKVDLSDMGETFPSLKNYKPSGWMELLPTKLAGEIGKGQAPQINGSLVLSNVSINPPSIPEPIKDINTKIEFTGKSADIKNMTLRLGSSDINLSAKIDKFSPLSLSYKLTSPKLHLSDIKKGESPSDKTEIIKELKSEGEISKRHNYLTFKGTLSSPEATLSGYELNDLETKFNLIDETLKIEDLNLKAYEGIIKGKGSYSFGSDSDFSLISNVRGLNLKKFLDSLNSDNAEKIQGKANFDINIFGNGAKWDEIKTTLKGTARAEIIDGAVLDINLADEVLKGVTGVPGLTLFISPRTKEKYPQVFTAQDTEFEEFKSSFTIEKGKMETQNLRITSKDYSITGEGWMNLDGKVDLNSVLVLSPKFSEDLETDVPDIKYITNRDDRVEIPFSISGTLPKAKPKPDIAYLAKLVQRTGIRKVIDSISSGSEEPAEENIDKQNQPTTKKKEKRLDKKIFDELKDLF
jgi:uncharacterized protein involved in outer membrane biogenesis